MDSMFSTIEFDKFLAFFNLVAKYPEVTEELNSKLEGTQLPQVIKIGDNKLKHA